MKARRLLTTLVLALGPVSLAVAAGPEAPAAPPAPAPLDVTMRVIEKPDEVAPEAVMRRIGLPPAPDAQAGAEEQVRERTRERAEAPEDAGTGKEIATQARERNREFGQEAAERAREMSENAAEQREEFGRSKAEQNRPERPEPPRPPRP